METAPHLAEVVAFAVVPLVILGFVGPLVAGVYLALKLNRRRPAA